MLKRQNDARKHKLLKKNHVVKRAFNWGISGKIIIFY